MPELPDVEVYREALAARVIGQPLHAIHVRNPFVLRTAVPPLDAVIGQTVRDVLRVGKRIVLAFDRELFLVLHLMIAGRLQWLPEGRKPPGKITLALFDFPTGTLAFTEAGTKRRASLHLARGEAALAAFDAGGLDVMDAKEPAFRERLFAATREVLAEWTARLRREAAGEFPQRVTAFRPEMAVHGRFGQPCPVCGAPVQRIVYAENESNYCARCQTGGVILADRALSRLLHKSFPRTLDES